MAATKTDVWNSATKMISDHFAEFIIMIILLVVAYAIIFLVFGAIEGQIIGRFFLGFDVTSFAIVTAIQAALIAVVYLWFIGAFYALFNSFSGKGQTNYVNILGKGIHGALAHTNSLVGMTVLAFVGGLAGVFLGGFGYLALFIEYIFLAGALGIGLVAFLDNKDWYNFWTPFSEVNKASPNGGIFLYLTLLVQLVPILNIIELAMVPLSVAILSQKK